MTAISVNVLMKISVYTKALILTCDSSINNDASIFCILYSNSINRDSQDCAKLFKYDTVCIIKWFTKAIVRFCCMGKIYLKM